MLSMRSLKEVKMSRNIMSSKKECMEAIDYFFTEGFIDELTSDKKYYTMILLNKVASDYNIKLQWEVSYE